MKKQEYKKPEISVVEMDSCAILAESQGISNDGTSVNVGGDIETGGDAGMARSPKSYDVWE